MKNSALKRIIAVVLCLVVFAGSELTGVINIVGDLFASENSEIEMDAADPVEETEEIVLSEEEPEPTEGEPQPEENQENAEGIQETEENPGTGEETEDEGNDSADVSAAEEGSDDESLGAEESNEDSGAVAEEEGGEESSGGETNNEDEELSGDEMNSSGEETSGSENENRQENSDGEADIDNEESADDEENAGNIETPEDDAAVDGENVTADGAMEEEQTEETEEESYPEFADQYTDDKVEIHVSAEEGVLPEGVVLSVTPIVKQDVEELEAQEEVTREEIELAKEVNEKYDVTAEKLEETAAEDETKNIAGFLAYDICFLVTETDEETGEEIQTEIEPNGNVSVMMDFADGYLPEELAENENVSIASVDVIHMKEEDGDVQPEVLTDATVNTTEKSEVKTAEFTVDSFSAFIIIWNGDDGEYTAQFNLVDMSRADIGGSSVWKPGASTTLNFEDISSNPDLSEIYTVDHKGETYTFVEARVADESNEQSPPAAIAEIRKGNGVIEWRRKESDQWENRGSSQVTFELFYTNASIKEVPSIDSTSKGVRLYMKDYDFDGYLMNEVLGTGQTDAQQGLVNPVLTDGFPVVKKDDVSLAPWFENGTEVNGLFRKDKFDEEGTFYYSCFENYAYLGTGDQFTLYDQVGTPEKTEQVTGEGSKIYVNRGNFFPYNKIVEGNFSNAKELYDENGNYYLDENGEPLYGGTGRSMYLIRPEEGKDKLNYHFSMRLETDFIQGTDGRYMGDEMIYRFNGDDDLWVFIDDVLVLDIGGNHPARSGSINFATGEVVVNQTSGPVKTTIKECFEKASQYCRENGIVKTIPDKWEEYEPGRFRFEDNSGHTLKMFYMERNHAERDGGSNLKVSFNLPTIDADKIRVTKELTGTAQTQYANVDFDFRVLVKNTSGSYDALKSEAEDDDGKPIMVDPDTGIFKLKPGQSAWFSGLPLNTEYYVEEIGYGKVDSDYIVEETTYQESETTDQDGETVKGTKTELKPVKERKRVIFTNKCSDNIKNNLEITKRVNGNLSGQESEKGPFEIKVWLEDRTGVLVPYVGDYYISGTEKSTNDGTILLSADETAIIQDLVAGTAFYVEELGLDTDVYEEPNISPVAGTFEEDDCKSVADADGTVKAAQGAVTRDKNAQVTVTNTLKGSTIGGLRITKKMQEDSMAVEGKEIFEFEVLLENESGKLEAYTGSYTLNGKTQSGNSKGIIEIPVNGTAEINNISEDTKYQVKEILAENSPYAEPRIETKTGEGAAASVQGGTAEGTITAGKYTDITVINSRKPEPSYSYDWQIVKKGTSEEGRNLAGAMFTLTLKADGSDSAEPYYGKSEEETGILRWYTSEKDAEDEKSPVEASQMEPGTYILKETKAPTGYVLSSASWTIVLDYESITVNDETKQPDPEKLSDEKQTFEFIFTNEALYELPSTGGAGIFGYMISGTLLMMAGILILYKRKYAGEVLKG